MLCLFQAEDGIRDLVRSRGLGYVYKRQGYNVSTQDDAHQQLTHGTSVAGIVGAKGNNGVGVSGVNWNVKLMLVSGADFESDVIEAYQSVSYTHLTLPTSDLV